MNRRERLEEEIKVLKKKLDRCFEKRLLTDDPQIEVNLERLEKKLDDELQKKEQELNQLSVNSGSKNRNALSFEDGLCNIDFERAKEIVHDVANRLTDEEGGSALFLMERCRDMEGRLLLRSLKDILGANTGQFVEYPIKFLPTMSADEAAFLKLLGAHLGLDFQDESDQPLSTLTEAVIKKISGRLRSGTTVLIPLTNWQILNRDYQVVFLDWFINQFWDSLVKAMSIVMKDYSPKVFCVIMVSDNMTDSCQEAKYFCDGQSFEGGKILRLPLTSWSQSDVRRWLSSYSSNLKKTQRDRLVNSIFNGRDEDLPLKIRVALEDTYSESVF